MLSRQFILLKRYNVNILKWRKYILGIETSCDDTGVAIIDHKGNLLNEHVHSQIKISSNIGGIIPTVAYQMHLFNIEPVVTKVMNKSNLSFKDLSVIAVTLKPGLPLSLKAGRDYAVSKAQEYGLPIIPIHHMEAHALTARMFDRNIEFPFVVFLISGGNCIIAVAHDVDSFTIYADRSDMSPGDCLDKIARMVKLTGNLGTHTDVSGGRAIELMARENTKPLIEFSLVGYNLLSFSFTGLEGAVFGYLKRNEIYDLPQLCASILYTMARQMCRKLQKVLMFCRHHVDIAPNTLVVSGGVASNLFFRECFNRVCEQFDYRLVCPPIEYCTDNGVMIAWNGYELYRLNKRFVYDVSTLDYCGRAPLGVNQCQDIKSKVLGVPKLKIKDLFIK